MNYVVFDTLTVDPKLLVAGQTYYVQLFPHKLAGDARPTPDDPCAISSTFVIEKSHTIYLKDGAELTDNTIVDQETAVLSSDLKILDLSARVVGDDGVTTTQQWITAKNMYFDWYLGSKDEVINKAPDNPITAGGVEAVPYCLSG